MVQMGMGKTEETPEAQVNRTKVGGLLEAGVSAWNTSFAPITTQVGF